MAATTGSPPTVGEITPFQWLTAGVLVICFYVLVERFLGRRVAAVSTVVGLVIAALLIAERG